MNRRVFLTTMAGGVAYMATGQAGSAVEGVALKPVTAVPQRAKTRVALIKTRDRATGIKRAIDLLGINPVQGKDVLLKPNFNSADPFPGSTHNDTLTHLILQLQNRGAKSITIGERSGIPEIGDVMQKKGIPELAAKLGVKLINFDDLPNPDWVHITPEKSHWMNGFDVAKPIIDSPCVVTTCCLKTHGSGGVFTMSLKLSVGVTRKANMIELHTSLVSIQKMIAEINLAYQPALVVMDGIDVFVDKGPSHGPIKQANVILAGTDRVAIDAIGVAILKESGSNKAIMDRKIFEQEQIARAVELGLGIARPEEIELVSDDAAGNAYAETVMQIALRG